MEKVSAARSLRRRKSHAPHLADRFVGHRAKENQSNQLEESPHGQQYTTGLSSKYIQRPRLGDAAASWALQESFLFNMTSGFTRFLKSNERKASSLLAQQYRRIDRQRALRRNPR